MIRFKKTVLVVSAVITAVMFGWALQFDTASADADNYLENTATEDHFDTLQQALDIVQSGENVTFAIHGTVTGDAVTFNRSLSEGTSITFTPANDGAVLDTQLSWSSNATAVFDGCTVGQPVTISAGKVKMNPGTTFRAETLIQNAAIIDDIKNVSFNTVKTSAYALRLQNTQAGEISGCSFLPATNQSLYGLQLLNAKVGSITGNTFNGQLTMEGNTSVNKIADQTFTAPTSQNCLRMNPNSARSDVFTIGEISNCTFNGASNSYALLLGSDNSMTIDSISGCRFPSGKNGMKIEGTGNNLIKTMSDCNFNNTNPCITINNGTIETASKITARSNSSAIDIRIGGIETLTQSNITGGSTAAGINLNGTNAQKLAYIGSIINTNISGSNGMYLTGNSKVGSIICDEIGANTITGTNMGIYNRSTIDEIINMNITGGNGIHIQSGSIGTIKNVNIIGTISAGISLNKYNAASSVGTIDSCIINAQNYGIFEKDQGTIDKVTNCQIEGAVKGIYLEERSEIKSLEESAVKGAIALDGLNSTCTSVKDSIIEGGTTGVSGTGMTYTLSGSNVVYGDNYAINVSQSAVALEPELTKGLGKGRYLGGTGIFLGTQYNYPTHAASGEEYDLSNTAKYDTSYTTYNVNERKYHALVAPVTLTYNGNGGQGEISPVQALTGDEVTIWKKGDTGGFEKTGFVMSGFNTKDDGSGDDYAPGSKITLDEDTTLYAQWKKEYTVKFDTRGGSTIAPQKVPEGDTVAKPDDPTKGRSDACDFGNWYTDEEFTEQYDFSKPVNDDITLYARWKHFVEVKPGPYPTPTQGFAYLRDNESLHGFWYWEGQTAKFTAKPVNGYEFLRWRWITPGTSSESTYSTDNPATYTMVKNDGTRKFVFTAIFQEVLYNVTVTDDGNGSAVADPTSGTKGTTVALSATPNDGYEFEKWEVISGGVTPENPDSAATTLTIGESDIKVKAVFSPIPKVTVSFDSDGGTPVGSQEIYINTKATKPDDPTKDDHTFLGWYIDDEEFDFDTPVEANIILKAKWEKNEPPAPEKHTITYKLNGGQYNGSTDDIVEEHEKGTMAKAHDAPEREGYTFQYWEGSKYYPGDDIPVDSDHILTAVWKKNEPTEPTDSDDPGEKDDPDDNITPAGGSDKNSHKASDEVQAQTRAQTQTGDSNAVYIWIFAMLCSLSVIATVLYRRKKSRSEF